MKTKKPFPRSVLSIDIGHKRIGLAGCDPLGITIKPLPALHRGNFDHDIEILKRHCQIRLVEGLVIGLPMDSKGLSTKQTYLCQRLGKRIAHSLQLPVAWVNEHSSSWSASIQFNLKKDRSGALDSAAAALILEQWLREGPELKPVHLTVTVDSKVVGNSGL
ncbi:Holliday junction resolvase RuvX [Prochlorococcus sp. MIT 1341]|uniref:Holliday junction resolvase RuvX n=1 Tax=Prochlorococcus sp. MIT 1341 TaxID=3096221 RepID=UPI002A75D9C0|nr:Holliday junction resolvase RuvX [Prochlorococcus sp. MIT 1341]